MASKKVFLVVFLVFLAKVESASIIERSYEYVMGLGKNLAPNFMALVDCMSEEDVWLCAKQKAGKMLDSWDEDVKKERRSWQDEADEETKQSGRNLEELPSRIGSEVESSLQTICDVLQHSVARSFTPKKHGGGIDTITISTDQKKDKKKKTKKPVKVVHVPAMMMMEKKEKGVQSWVVGEGGDAEGKENGSVQRGFLEDAWSLGEKAIDSVAEHAMEVDNTDNGVSDKSSVDEQRGKKKKKKKAILKLLLLGAVLKAKIGTLLQILSFKLQVKFLLIALAGLLINVARFWIDVKKQHAQPPQKVIYYEHAQHQHHYDHEEEPGWGGPWSRSMDPEETPEGETVHSPISPYHAQERYQPAFIRPAPTRI